MTMILPAQRRAAAAAVMGFAAFCTAGPALGACSHLVNGSIVLTVQNNVALGILTRPDNGQPDAFVTVAPNDARSIPGNLVINNAGGGNPLVTQPKAAEVTISGGANCGFRITATPVAPGVVAATLAPDTGYSFAVPGNPAEGTLDALGKFKLTIGATATVSAGAGSVGGDITVTVIYF